MTWRSSIRRAHGCRTEMAHEGAAVCEQVLGRRYSPLWDSRLAPGAQSAAHVGMQESQVNISAASLAQIRRPAYKSAIERILATIEKNHNGCWIWKRKLNHAGYGQIRDCGRYVGTHRVTYQHFKGPIPEGLHIDHLCRTPACCNPEHLEAVTCKENLRRGIGVNAINSGKTHCLRGHPLSGPNLYRDPKGRRRCRECCREDMRRRRAAV